MNLRIMTIGSVCSMALGLPLALFAADERGSLTTNPLRGSNRNPATENVLRSFPAQPPAESNSPPRSQSGVWRNPGWFRPADGPAPSGINPPPNATPLSAAPGPRDAGQPSVAEPPRTLIQRIRERRLAQLEKQAERLRELSERDAQRPVGSRNSANPNGPGNPDLQIDLGIPVDASEPADTGPSDRGEHAAPGETNPAWTPDRWAPPTDPRPPELNPPADPPIDIQIDLPSDLERPQPKPPAQARLRSWWSSPPR